MSRPADRLRAAAVAAAVVVTLSLARDAFAQTDRPLREDLDHRYRLTIHVPEPTASLDEVIPTTLCLSPIGDDRRRVCLGEFQGHDLIGDGAAKTIFTLPPEEHPLCTCARPVELVSDTPLCWPLPARILDVGVREPVLRGFVTGMHQRPVQ